ncbi:MAG: hypothetical protein PHQ59_05420 [Candidatus Daviesbacteria bacterium]|nr:hypothetical protein [Candidatus Daviesbacteria bacterium]
MSYIESGIVPYLAEHPKTALVLGATLCVAMGGYIYADHQLDVMTSRHYGEYLQSQGRDYLLSETPQVTRITLLPVESMNKEGDILLRRYPTLQVPLQRLPREEVNIKYGALVFGAGYHPGYQRTKNSNGNLYLLGKLEEGSKFSSGGLWLKLTDKEGNSIDPYGNILNPQEKPFYTSNDFEILPE